MTTLTGIDVSNFQGGAFDWTAWRGRIQFAFAKATEGTGFRDPDFARNWQQMKAEGITRGAYHFLHAGLSGADQARYFLADVRPEPGDLLAVDVEQAGLDGKDAAEVSAVAAGFANEVCAATGARPWAYTEISLAEGGYLAQLGESPLWLANPSQVPTPAPIGPWRLVSAEQTGQRGVDADVFYGDAAGLARLAVPAPKPKPVLVSKASATAALATLVAYVAEG
jgi:GH25 family lysozyme M1 (1,4-beta-N-acetylmuramidase)